MAEKNLIKRTRRNCDYTIVNNSILRDKNLSFEAKGMLCYILSLPDDWILHTSKLMNDFKIGRHYLKRCFDEIEKAGYMAKFGVVKGKGGRFEGYNYMFYDTPIAESPRADFPHAVLPHTEEQHLLITNIDNKELTNTNKPLTPFEKGEQEIEGIDKKVSIDLEVKDWIDTWRAIYRHVGLFKPMDRIDKNQLKRYILKCKRSGRNHRDSLQTLQWVLKDSWQSANGYPDARLSRLFKVENFDRYAPLKRVSDDSDIFGRR